jgi:NADP-dependent 3-hydroxy acid dehydrogenase YdfG
VQRGGQRVGGKDVHAPADHERRRVRPRVHQLQELGAYPLGARGGAAAARRRSRQLVQVRRSVVVEAKRPCQRVDHLLRGMALAALLEADVVVGADAGQRGQLLPAQARHTAPSEVREADVLRSHALAPGAQELADPVVALHRIHGTRCRPARVAVSLPGPPFTGVRGLWLTGAAATRVSAMTTATDTFDRTQTTQLPLAGRVAVVTGATSGIGAATARRLAADGAAVALLGRREERLRDLAPEVRDATGATVMRVTADVSDPETLERAADSIRGELGRVDLVVANAGVMLAAPFEQADTAEWDRMLDTNVRGLLATGRAFADDLLAAAAEGGRADLVHVGSIGGHEVFPNYAVYGATKAAVAHLTRNLRTELGPRGVRVKNVEPGLVGTELGDDMQDTGIRQALASWRGEIGALPPEDIADAIAFAVAAPPRVNVAELIVLPTVQG